MPLTISNNSAVASASYYLDKNQKNLAEQHQASGQRKENRGSQRGSRNLVRGDEAKRGGQPIVWSQEQCAERYLIRGDTGRRTRDRRPNRRTYG